MIVAADSSGSLNPLDESETVHDRAYACRSGSARMALRFSWPPPDIPMPAPHRHHRRLHFPVSKHAIKDSPIRAVIVDDQDLDPAQDLGIERAAIDDWGFRVRRRQVSL